MWLIQLFRVQSVLIPGFIAISSQVAKPFNSGWWPVFPTKHTVTFSMLPLLLILALPCSLVSEGRIDLRDPMGVNHVLPSTINPLSCL